MSSIPRPSTAATWSARVVDALGSVKGTGFLVAPDLVVTCAHVVEFAQGLSEGEQRGTPRQPVMVEFPALGPGQVSASVVYWPARVLSDSDDDAEYAGGPGAVDDDELSDIALLRLRERVPVRPAHLVDSVNVRGHRFSAYGYADRRGMHTEGEVLAEVSSALVQLAVDRDRPPIVEGFSGSAVWDLDGDGVVGMTTKAGRAGDAKVGFMISSQTLDEVVSLVADVRPDTGRRVKPIALANGSRSTKRELANAIRANWFSARLQFFEHEPDAIVETEGWRDLITWLRQFDDPATDDVEGRRELVDRWLRPSGPPANIKVLRLLTWADPEGVPVWRGQRITYRKISRAALAVYKSGTTNGLYRATKHADFWRGLSGFTSMSDAELWFRRWRASVDEWQHWRRENISVLRDLDRLEKLAALAASVNPADRARSYHAATKALLDSLPQAQGAAPTRSPGLDNATVLDRRVEALLLPAVLLPGEDPLLASLSRMAAAQPPPGTVPWYDALVARQSPMNWVGRVALVDAARADAAEVERAKEKALKKQAQKNLEAIDRSREKVRSAFLRGLAWNALQAAAITAVACLVLLLTSNVDRGKWILTELWCAPFLLVVMLLFGWSIYATGTWYRPPLHQPIRLLKVLAKSPRRVVAKIGLALSWIFATGGLGDILYGEIGIVGQIFAIPLDLVLFILAVGCVGTPLPWSEEAAGAYPGRLQVEEDQLRRQADGERSDSP